MPALCSNEESSALTASSIPSEDEPHNDGDEASALLPGMSAATLWLDKRHFGYLHNCHPEPRDLPSGDHVEGKSPREWYAGGPPGKPTADLERFGNGLNRLALIALQADRTIPTLDVCIATSHGACMVFRTVA